MSQNIILIIIIIALAAGVYVWYQYFSTPSGVVVEPVRLTIDLAQLERLQNLEFDTSVLRDPFFMGMESPQNVPQPERAVGRANPFLPL